MKRYAVFLAFALLLLLPTTVAAAECQFIVGFATLRDLIGHDIVGECLENEHHGENGDSLQQTSGGLLVWRKADNWTAFTDGYRSWVNGPYGLEQRLNTERFDWEIEDAIAALPSTDQQQWIINGLRRLSQVSQPSFLAWMEQFSDDLSGGARINHIVDIAQIDEVSALKILQMPFLETRDQGKDWITIWILADLAKSDPVGLKQILSHPRLRGGITDDDAATVALLDLGLRDSEAAAAIEALSWVKDGVSRPAHDNISSGSNEDGTEDEAQVVIDLVETAFKSRQAFFSLLTKSWIHDNLTVAEAGVISNFNSLSGWDAAVAWRISGMPFLETIGKRRAGQEFRIIETLRNVFLSDPSGVYWILFHPTLANGISDEHEVDLALLRLELEDPERAAMLRSLPWIEDGISFYEEPGALLLQDLAMGSDQVFRATMRKTWVWDGLSVDEKKIIGGLIPFAHRGYSGRDEELALRIVEMPFLSSVNPADAAVIDSLLRLRQETTVNYMRQVFSHPRLRDGIRDDQTALVSVLGNMPERALELLDTLP